MCRVLTPKTLNLLHRCCFECPPCIFFCIFVLQRPFPFLMIRVFSICCSGCDFFYKIIWSLVVHSLVVFFKLACFHITMVYGSAPPGALLVTGPTTAAPRAVKAPPGSMTARQIQPVKAALFPAPQPRRALCPNTTIPCCVVGWISPSNTVICFPHLSDLCLCPLRDKPPWGSCFMSPPLPCLRLYIRAHPYSRFCSYVQIF